MDVPLQKLAWLLLLVQQASAFCPPFMAQETACTCFAYLDGAVVKCKGASAPAAVEKLKAVSAEVRELSIEDANIVEIGPRAFRNLRVKNLILDNNHIRSIHADAFRGLEETLVSLSLAHNRLTEIPTDALMGMNNLQVLNLKCNSIGNLYNSAFRNVSHLIELNLGCNQICKIAGPAFETVKDTVQSLILDQNCLKEIPAEALRNFKQLIALHLQYNAITSIEKLQLMNMVSLLMIRLSGNKIRSIDRYGFNNVPNLRYLFLDQNELVSVEPNTLQQFKFLEILDLSYNNIAEITAGAFNGLEHLLQLNLDGNSIKDIAPGAFANSPLLLLLLGHNCLTAISQQMFQGVPFLRQISLTNNNIRLVQPFSFNGLPNLHMLDLTSNKIQSVQPTAITINPQTTVLLQENPMVCTQGGYHIIQSGQPTMLLSESNNVCKKGTGKNSTATEEDTCPTRKEVPSQPVCCSVAAQTTVTSVTSSIERLLHQSTPTPQKSLLDLGSLLPSLGKTAEAEATTVSATTTNDTEQTSETGDNNVRFSSNRRLNMDRFWRFTAAPRNRQIAPGIHAIPVTSPSVVNGRAQGGGDGEAGNRNRATGSDRPKVVPAGDAFDATGLVTEAGQTDTVNEHKMMQHTPPSDQQSKPDAGKQIQTQFNEDEESPSQNQQANVLPNIRQPVGGVNFQGVPPGVRQQQNVGGPFPQPSGTFFGPPNPVFHGPQNLRPSVRGQVPPAAQQQGQQQFGGSQGQGQPQQPRQQFSFGQPIPQRPQGVPQQFIAQPPRGQQNSVRPLGPPQQVQNVNQQGRNPNQSPTQGQRPQQFQQAPQGVRQQSAGSPSVQPPAPPHAPGAAVSKDSPVSQQIAPSTQQPPSNSGSAPSAPIPPPAGGSAASIPSPVSISAPSPLPPGIHPPGDSGVTPEVGSNGISPPPVTTNLFGPQSQSAPQRVQPANANPAPAH